MQDARGAGHQERSAAAPLTQRIIDRATLAIRVTCSGPVHPDTHDALVVLLATNPDAIDLRFAHACLLEDLGRLAAAATAYGGILARVPLHRGALTNAATMLYVDGRLAEALGLYRRAAEAYPNDAALQLNLANVLADGGNRAASRACYERALELDPAHAAARYALASLLAEDGDAMAETHRELSFAQPVVHVTRSTAATPLRVLVPIAANGGNLVSTLMFDADTVETTTLVAESFARNTPLPAHDLIFNAVADADRSSEALLAVDAIVAASGRPCINLPAAVRATGRVMTAVRLAPIPGVVVPRTARFARSTLSARTLTEAGFAFPLLLRSPGFHAGRHFVRVATPADVRSASDALPSDDVLAIAFIDTRRADERFRKFRVLSIDGALVPFHLAVGRSWNVHYFSADNAVREASRTEEAAFLADARTRIGSRAYIALERIRDVLGLDYGGIDFALDAQGNAVVFEANASFAMYWPAEDATATYRRPIVAAAIDAVREMIRVRALRGRALVGEDGAFDHRENSGPA